MLAVGVGEVITRSTEPILDFFLRLVQLAAKLVAGQRRQMRMRHRMRTNRNSAIGVLEKRVPAHRRELLRIVPGKLGKRQRRSRTRVTSTDENLDGHNELLERREDARRTPKCVVESRAYRPEARQDANLPQQEIGLDR